MFFIGGENPGWWMYVLHSTGGEDNWGRFGATGLTLDEPPPKHPPSPDHQQKLASAVDKQDQKIKPSPHFGKTSTMLNLKVF